MLALAATHTSDGMAQLLRALSATSLSEAPSQQQQHPAPMALQVAVGGGAGGGYEAALRALGGGGGGAAEGLSEGKAVSPQASTDSLTGVARDGGLQTGGAAGCGDAVEGAGAAAAERRLPATHRELLRESRRLVDAALQAATHEVQAVRETMAGEYRRQVMLLQQAHAKDRAEVLRNKAAELQECQAVCDDKLADANGLLDELRTRADKRVLQQRSHAQEEGVALALQNQQLRETLKEQVELLKDKHADELEALRKNYEQTLGHMRRAHEVRGVRAGVGDRERQVDVVGTEGKGLRGASVSDPGGRVRGRRRSCSRCDAPARSSGTFWIGSGRAKFRRCTTSARGSGSSLRSSRPSSPPSGAPLLPRPVLVVVSAASVLLFFCVLLKGDRRGGGEGESSSKSLTKEQASKDAIARAEKHAKDMAQLRSGIPPALVFAADVAPTMVYGAGRGVVGRRAGGT